MASVGLKELRVDFITNIVVGKKCMQLSKRDLSNNVKYYLHFPLHKVTKEDEISKTLFFALYKIR